jgi:hypothetical protein
MKNILMVLMLLIVGFIATSFSNKPVYERKSAKDSVLIAVDVRSSSLNQTEKKLNGLYKDLITSIQDNNSKQVKDILNVITLLNQTEPTKLETACNSLDISLTEGNQIIRNNMIIQKICYIITLFIIVGSVIYITFNYNYKLDFRRLITSLVYIAIFSVIFSFIIPRVATSIKYTTLMDLIKLM